MVSEVKQDREIVISNHTYTHSLPPQYKQTSLSAAGLPQEIHVAYF